MGRIPRDEKEAESELPHPRGVVVKVRRLNGILGLSLSDMTILYLVALLNKTVSVG